MKVHPSKLERGLRASSARIPYTLRYFTGMRIMMFQLSGVGLLEGLIQGFYDTGAS